MATHHAILIAERTLPDLDPEQLELLEQLQDMCSVRATLLGCDTGFRDALADFVLSLAARDAKFRRRLGLKALRGHDKDRGESKKNGRVPGSPEQHVILLVDHAIALQRLGSATEAIKELARLRGVGEKAIEKQLKAARHAFPAFSSSKRSDK